MSRIYYISLKFLLALCLCLILQHTGKAQIIVNEVSNGPNGFKEFVELVVFGTPGTTQDIRGWVIDDNGGNYGCSTGKGIAPGHYKFDSIPNWECVPSGSIILLYNPTDKNPAISGADDPTDVNQDRIYILPINEVGYFIEVIDTPSASACSYWSTPGVPNSGASQWNLLGMSNSNDLFQTIRPFPDDTGSFQAIGWGGIGPPVTKTYFAGSGSNKTFQFRNNVSSNFNVQANWNAMDADMFDSPGEANSPNNQRWLDSMRLRLIVSDTVICVGGSILFSDNTTGGIQSWDWDFDDGSPNGSGQVVNHTYTQPGNYMVELTVITTQGCQFVEHTFVDVVNTLPVFITGDTLICPGEQAELIGLGGDTLEWFLDGNSLGLTDDTILVSTPGKYTLRVSDHCGGESDTFNVIVGAPGTPPTVSGGNTICIGDSVQISQIGATNFEWFFNGIPMGATNSPIWVFDPGQYSVTSYDGCPVNSNTLTITNPATVFPVISGDTVLCIDDTITLTVSGADTVEWFLDGNSLGLTDTVIEITVPGAYLVKAYDGCGGISDTLFVTNPLSAPTITGDNVFCPGDSVQLTGAGGDTLEWFRNSISTGQTDPMIWVKVPGDYTLKSYDGCGGVSAVFTVSQLPDINLNVSPANTVACEGATITFSSSSTGTITSREWTLDGTTLGSDPTLDHNFIGPGTYQIVLTVETSDNCTFRDTADISIESRTPLSVSGDSIICSGASVALASNIAQDIQWQLDSNDIPGATDSVYIADQTGEYRVIFGGVCTDTSDIIVVAEGDKPVADFEFGISGSSDTTIYEDDNIQFTYTGSDVASWLWFFNDVDQTTSTETNPVHAYTSAGGFDVRLIVQNDDGCFDTVIHRVHVQPKDPGNYGVPAAFSPNNDNQNDQLKVLGTGVDELLSFRVFNRWGEIVFETTNINVGWDGTYKGKPQVVGVYVYQLNAKLSNGDIINEKGPVTLIR